MHTSRCFDFGIAHIIQIRHLLKDLVEQDVLSHFAYLFLVCKNGMIKVLCINGLQSIVSVLWAGYRLDFVVTNHVVYRVDSSV